MKIEVYFCSRCKGAVSSSDRACPHCSMAFGLIHCPACNYIGDRDAYDGDRCPQCGCRRLVFLEAD